MALPNIINVKLLKDNLLSVRQFVAVNIQVFLILLIPIGLIELSFGFAGFTEPFLVYFSLVGFLHITLSIASSLNPIRR